ncbi:MAG TPA: PilZ domain-containing protein [Pyrinomonadaceae bacterium]|nr:PilZ domain-containing protein [Pyrinomonadaceae bacterium]
MSQSEETVILDPSAVTVADRRSNGRVQVHLPAAWEGNAGRHEGTVSDISPGGCFLLTGGKVLVRELIRVEIQLPIGVTVVAWGEVANHFPDIGFGVRYTVFDGEEREHYLASIKSLKHLKGAVAPLRKLEAEVVRREPEQPARILTTPEQYRAMVLRAFPKVNQALLHLPECRRKSEIRQAMEAHMDASRAWDAMLKDDAAARRAILEAHRRMKERYGAPPEVLKALLLKEPHAVLTFLWLKASLYLASA